MRAGVQVASASCRTVASGCRHRDGLTKGTAKWVAVGSVRLGSRLACEVGNPHSELLRREGKTPWTNTVLFRPSAQRLRRELDLHSTIITRTIRQRNICLSMRGFGSQV